MFARRFARLLYMSCFSFRAQFKTKPFCSIDGDKQMTNQNETTINLLDANDEDKFRHFFFY